MYKPPLPMPKGKLIPPGGVVPMHPLGRGGVSVVRLPRQFYIILGNYSGFLFSLKSFKERLCALIFPLGQTTLDVALR